MSTCFKTPTRLAAAATLALTLGTGASAAQTDTVRMVITHKPGPVAMAQAKRAIEQAGGTIKVELSKDNAIAFEVPRSMLAKLQTERNGAFTNMEEDAKRYLVPTVRAAMPMAERVAAAAAERTNGPNSTESKPYGISMVAGNSVPRSQVSNRKVCIIDSGMQASHEDLKRVPTTGSHDKGSGDWDSDVDGHGTHVSGTIAAVNNSRGVVGVVANAKLPLHMVKVFDGGGWAYSSNLVAAAEECQAAGANIISMSLGGPINSASEARAFQRLQDEGILSIAAAGNSGNSALSYPASHPAVMSVAALDDTKTWASYSQYNSQVEIAAPGTAVRSTVPMGWALVAGVTVDAASVAADAISGSPAAEVTAPLADFGLALNAEPGAMTGKVCLIKRGDATFEAKVVNCEQSGGVAAVIYNNVPGTVIGMMEPNKTTIPSVTVTDTDGATLLTQLGQNTKVSVKVDNYDYYSGTSMATPHVSAVAALVWSNFPQCTAKQIRAALDASAQDVGAPGRDDKTGFGLVQGRAAYDYLRTNGCGN